MGLLEICIPKCSTNIGFQGERQIYLPLESDEKLPILTTCFHTRLKVTALCEEREALASYKNKAKGIQTRK